MPREEIIKCKLLQKEAVFLERTPPMWEKGLEIFLKIMAIQTTTYKILDEVQPDQIRHDIT